MRHKKVHHIEEPNLIPFLNLLVILIPYMLLNAVFTQVAALQVTMPNNGPGSGAQEPPKPLVLEVVIYKDRFMVADRQSGPLKDIPMNAKGQMDYAALNSYLQNIKGQYPQVTEASILLEDNTAYDKLIHTMDAVRVVVKPGAEPGKEVHSDLFPDISIGDAPADTGGVKK